MQIDDVSGALELDYHGEDVEVKVVRERDVDHIRLAMASTSTEVDIRMSAPLSADQAQDLADKLDAHSTLLKDE